MPSAARPLLALLAGLLLAGCGGGEPAAPAVEVPLVEAARVAIEPSREVLHEYTGVVIASEHDDVGFELGGTLRHVPVDEGDRVAAGQVLAELDTALLAAERRQLEAARAENAARAQLVAANLEREQRLKRSGFAAEQRLDELRAEQQALAAGAESIAANLAANDARLAKARLVAPYDGVVTRRYRDTGAAVLPGTPVLRLIEAEAREARAGVPARLAPGLVPGTSLEVRAGEALHPARVIALGTDLDPATRTLSLRLALPALPGLAEGELIGVRVPERLAGSGAWLPATALAEGLRGLWVVYALVPGAEGDLLVEARDVEVLQAGAERVFVRGAIVEGEQVVAGGLQRVAPGQRVRLAPAPGA